MEKFQTTNITIFDNHEQSTEVLRGFLLAHSQYLSKMKINKEELNIILEKYLPYIENYKEKYQIALLQHMDGIVGSKDNLVVPFLTIRYLCMHGWMDGWMDGYIYNDDVVVDDDDSDDALDKYDNSGDNDNDDVVIYIVCYPQ